MFFFCNTHYVVAGPNFSDGAEFEFAAGLVVLLPKLSTLYLPLLGLVE